MFDSARRDLDGKNTVPKIPDEDYSRGTCRFCSVRPAASLASVCVNQSLASALWVKTGGSLQREALFSGVWESPAGAVWELGVCGLPGRGWMGRAVGETWLCAPCGTAEFPLQPWAGAECGEQLPEKELNGNGSRVAGRRSRGGVECQQLGHNPQGQCKHLAFDSSYQAGGQ